MIDIDAMDADDVCEALAGALAKAVQAWGAGCVTEPERNVMDAIDAGIRQIRHMQMEIENAFFDSTHD